MRANANASGQCRGRRRSRITVRVGRAIASLEPDLVRPMTLRPVDEEVSIERDAALRARIGPQSVFSKAIPRMAVVNIANRTAKIIGAPRLTLMT